MQKITTLVTILVLAVTVFSQQSNPSTTIKKIDYLQKSRHQRVLSGILLGGGFLCMNFGGTMGGKSSSGFSNVASGVLIISGAAAICSSVPLFFISFVTKSKDMKMSFKTQALPQVNNNSFVYKSIPSINLKISL